MKHERFWLWVAHHLPHVLVYWCFIRVAAHATVRTYPDRTPEQVNIMEALQAWSERA